MNTLIDEINKRSQKKRSIKNIKMLRFDDVSQLRSQFDTLNLSSIGRSWNAMLFTLLLAMFLFFFLAKSFNLQVINGNENLVLADGNRVRIAHTQAERGLILDRNGEVLVRNVPAFSLNMSTEGCLPKEYCINMLDKFISEMNLKVDVDRVKKEIEQGKLNVVILTGIEKEELLTLEPKLSNYPVFTIGISPKRQYLYGDAFAHLIGYVGLADTIYPSIEGKTGIEEKYDNYLKGISGGEIIQVNSSGYKINTISEKKTVPGDALKLYVDKDLQVKAYELLKDKVDKGEATAGVVVASDPKTGGILALVSYPSFDPNLLTTGLTSKEFEELINKPNFPFFNRAISAVYPPASTFKIVMGAAALMEKVIDPDYEIFDKGYIQVGSYIFRNWNTSGHGNVDMRRAIQVSNDTYFYTVGGGYNEIGGLGIDKIYEWALKFGFSKTSGIDLFGEVSGSMPNGKDREWYLGDTYITSIGQGDILSTPLQVNNAMSYYANGSTVYSPRVVKSINDKSTDTEILFSNILDNETLTIIKEGLNKAVTPGGTAYPLYDLPTKYNGLEFAGKTGTAEFGNQENTDTHAWFTVFGPLKDPSIVVTIFLEEGGSGSDDAAPIARGLLGVWFDKYK